MIIELILNKIKVNHSTIKRSVLVRLKIIFCNQGAISQIGDNIFFDKLKKKLQGIIKN